MRPIVKRIAKIAKSSDLAATAEKMGGVLLGKSGYLPKYLSRHLFGSSCKIRVYNLLSVINTIGRGVIGIGLVLHHKQCL